MQFEFVYLIRAAILSKLAKKELIKKSQKANSGKLLGKMQIDYVHENDFPQNSLYLTNLWNPLEVRRTP